MKIFTLFMISSTFSVLSVQAKDPLKQCWQQQVEPLKNRCLAISFDEEQHELYHSPEPWMQISYTGSGKIWYDKDHFAKQDTFTAGKRKLYAKMQLSRNELLLTDYGSEELSPVTKDMLTERLLETARYEPATLIHYFSDKNTSGKKQTDNGLILYQLKIDESIVSLYLRSTDNLAESISILSNDDLCGDVLTTYTYSSYTTGGGLHYPRKISIDKFNGKVHDEVNISAAFMTTVMPALLSRPKEYFIKEKPVEKPDISVEHYNAHIHFINMRHAGIKAMVAEFKDFVLVVEAPLSERNGTLLIAETRKIAPGKEIKYFSFGHHHPHYIGGMRAFIHKEATVLSVKDDLPYLHYIAEAPHSLKPDSLQLVPKPIRILEITDSVTITDGTYAMNIYHIGKKSGHTSDYLVYYFPEEKMLFEGDLVWIENKGEPKKAGATQAGLYNAIKDLNLEVNTIIQSWGILSEKYKMHIPFSELEHSMRIKQDINGDR